MKIVLRIVLVAALATLGVWLWLVLFPGPEKIIRRRLTELARSASTSISEGDLARLAAARQLAGFFSTNVELAVDLPGLSQHNVVDREEITQLAMMPRSRTVRFPDINVTVAPDKQSAVADVTVDAEISGEAGSQVQEMKFNLKKIDGEWLIVRVETVHTLSQDRQIFPRYFNLCTAAGSFHS